MEPTQLVEARFHVAVREQRLQHRRTQRTSRNAQEFKNSTQIAWQKADARLDHGLHGNGRRQWFPRDRQIGEVLCHLADQKWTAARLARDAACEVFRVALW